MYEYSLQSLFYPDRISKHGRQAVMVDLSHDFGTRYLVYLLSQSLPTCFGSIGCLKVRKAVLADNWITSIPLQNRKFQNFKGRFRTFRSRKCIRTGPEQFVNSISSLQTSRKQLESSFYSRKLSESASNRRFCKGMIPSNDLVSTALIHSEKRSVAASRAFESFTTSDNLD